MLICLLALAVAGDSPPPPRIVAIEVIRHDVFDLTDPETAAWPYRMANALHILTRERFIRSLLLFREGDRWDPSLAEESERILRGTGFLNPVSIRAKPVKGGVVVVVEARDQWTTELSLNYGRLGQRQKAGISLSEQNFLGWGKTVYLDARSDPERDAVTFGFTDPLFLATRWRLKLAHREASDGTADGFSLEYPFFSLGTLWAGGIRWRRESLVEHLWAQGKKQVSGNAMHRSLELWGGFRLAGDGERTRRVTLGLFREKSTFSHWTFGDGRSFPEPQDRQLGGLRLGFASVSSRWQVATGFRGWWRQEDLPLGPDFSCSLGIPLSGFSGDSRAWPFSLNFFQASLLGRLYRWLAANTQGRWQHGGARDNVTRLEAGFAFLGDQGFRGRAVLERGFHLDLDRQLTLGADSGLRGWDPDSFDGTSRAVVNLEWRQRLTGEVLHLAVLGLVLFADAGKTWGARVGADTRGWRGDVGVGLLAEVTRAAILRVVRLEVSFPDDGTGPTVLLTGVSLF